MTQPTPQELQRITVTPEATAAAGATVPIPTGPIGVEQVKEDRASFADLLKAATRRENLVGAALGQFIPQDGPTDAPASWNPYSYFKANESAFKDIAPYVLRGQFDTIFSERDFHSKADVLRRQLADQQTLERGGTVGVVTQLGAGLFDPTNLLPLLPLNSTSRLINAGRLGASLAAQSAVQEGALHAMDGTRTGTESAMGIMAAGTLGSAVGSLYRHFDVPGTRLHPSHPENPLLPSNLDKEPVTVRGVGEDPSAALTITDDSVGAARARAHEIEKAVPGNAVGAAIVNGIDKVLDHASPLARVWEWPSAVGRRMVAGTMDLGGRLTKGMNEGRALPNAEAEVHLERQYLAGYQDQIADHYRAANMDMGQSAVGSALGNLVEHASQGAVNMNRVQRSDFESAVVNMQAAKKLEAYGHGNQMVAVVRDLRAAWAAKGFAPDQVDKIMARVDAAAKDVDAFHERYKRKAIDSGLWDGENAQSHYGFSMLYNSGAINANPGLMRSLLIRRLTDTPADEFLEEFAARPVMGPDGKAATRTVEDVKNDPRAMDEARIEWRGEQELAATNEAEARLASATRKQDRALAELEVLKYGTRAVEKEKRIATVAQGKAAVREQVTGFFGGRLNRLANNVAALSSRAEDAEARLVEIATERARLEAGHAGAKLDEAGSSTAAATAAHETDAGKLSRLLTERGALGGDIADAGTVRELRDMLGTAPDAIAKTQKRLTELRDAEAKLRLEIETARRDAAVSRGLLEDATREFNQAAKVVGMRQREIERTVLATEQTAKVRDRNLKVTERLAHEADDKWREAVGLLEQAKAERRARMDEWRAMRTANKLTGAELRAAAREVGRAKAAVKRTQKATPMEVYIDQQLQKLRGGAEATNGMLIEKVGDSNRFKEVTYKWSPEELRELMSNGLIETDLNSLMARYHRDLTGRIALHRSIGTADPAEAARLIAEDYDKLIAKYREAGDSKTADKLVRMSEKNQADAVLMMKKALGRVRPGGEGDESVVWWADKLRTAVYLGAAGGFIMSAVNDSATGMLVSSGALVGLIKHGRGYSKILKAARTSDKEDLRHLRTLLSSLEGSMHLPAEGNMLGELAKDAGSAFGDPASRSVKARVDRATKFAGDAVNRVTGLAAWSNHVRRTAALSNLNEIIYQAKNLEKMDSATRAKFASLGLGTQELRDIGRLAAKHGEKWNNLTLPNTAKWLTEPGGEWAAEALDRALVMTQRRASYVPGYGAVPNIMSKWWGALLGQFQSYGFQFTHSFVQAGTQRLLTNGDMQVAYAFGVNMGLTALVSSVRAHIKGEDTDQWDKRKWANELVTRGGMLGWTAPYADAAMKLADPHGEFFMPSSRYRNNNAFESLAGPTAGYLGTLGKAATAAREGDTATLRKQLTRIAPLHQNAAMLQTLEGDLFD